MRAATEFSQRLMHTSLLTTLALIRDDLDCVDAMVAQADYSRAVTETHAIIAACAQAASTIGALEALARHAASESATPPQPNETG